MLLIQNDGTAIKETNFWTSRAASMGLMLCSVNAGALRLMVPRRTFELYPLSDWNSGEYVTLEDSTLKPGEAFDFVFEDSTSTPFSVTLGFASFDRMMTGPAATVDFLIYTANEDGTGQRLVRTTKCHIPRITQV